MSLRRALPLATALAASLTGCRGPTPGPRPALKEVYVEVAPLSSAVARKVTFPLDATVEGEVYSAGVRFDGASARAELLAELTAPADARVELGDPDDPPALLLLPDNVTAREASCVYVGHAAFAPEPGVLGVVEVLHHVRLLVVNRELEPVRVDLRAVTLADGDGATLEPRGAADADGAALETLELFPGESGLAHLFFAGPGVPERVVLRWTVERRPDVEAAPPSGARATAQPVELVLGRRYVVDGPLSALEDLVARGDTIPPPAARRREPWAEPRLSGAR